MAVEVTPSYFYLLYCPSECELRLYLNSKGTKPAEPSEFEKLILDLGQRHEKKHLSTFPEYTDLTGQSTEAATHEIRKGTPVIYQGELRTRTAIDGRELEVTGIPDFLLYDGVGYLVRDCKLARRVSEEEHPEILRQLQIYGWLLERTAGKSPGRLEVLKGDGEIHEIPYEGEPAVLSHLSRILEIVSLPEAPYSPVGWSKCGGCGYNELCMKKAEREQSAALLPDVDQGLARRLRDLGVVSIEGLFSKYDQRNLSTILRQ